MEDRIAVLLDKQEIHETTLRYFRGVDRCDGELMKSAFHPDAVITQGELHRTGAEMGDNLTRLHENYRATMHCSANQVIDVHGDRAGVETYALNYHLFDRGGREHVLVRALRYVDGFERRDGQWKIAQRRVICEWDQIEPIAERSTFPPYVPAMRSRDDISYQTYDVN